jgi:DNA-directed RNA polymerase subunit alpha
MEITADSGKGYVPAVANRPADAPIGLIPVDSLYSPVRQVAYKIDPKFSALRRGRAHRARAGL